LAAGGGSRRPSPLLDSREWLEAALVPWGRLATPLNASWLPSTPFGSWGRLNAAFVALRQLGAALGNNMALSGPLDVSTAFAASLGDRIVLFDPLDVRTAFAVSLGDRMALSDPLDIRTAFAATLGNDMALSGSLDVRTTSAAFLRVDMALPASLDVRTPFAVSWAGHDVISGLLLPLVAVQKRFTCSNAAGALPHGCSGLSSGEPGGKSRKTCEKTDRIDSRTMVYRINTTHYQ